MSITIYETEGAAGAFVEATARLFTDDAHTRLVPEGHQDAAFHFCDPGDEVLRVEFEALGGTITTRKAEAARAKARAKAKAAKPKGGTSPRGHTKRQGA